MRQGANRMLNYLRLLKTEESLPGEKSGRLKRVKSHEWTGLAYMQSFEFRFLH